MIDSNDGGVDITSNGGETWYAPPLPICQFYHIAVDNRVPYRVVGHDAGPRHRRGPEQQPARRRHRARRLARVGGGEAGHVVSDPSDPNIVYAGEYVGIITRYDHRTRQARNVSVWPDNPSGHGGEDMKYRFQWTAPILVSPHDPEGRLPRAPTCCSAPATAARPGTPISPDLTRNDKTQAEMVRRPDHRRQHRRRDLLHHLRHRRVAEAEGPALGRQRRRPGPRLARRRQDLDERHRRTCPACPSGARSACIEPSPFDAGTAYVVVDAHRLDDMQPVPVQDDRLRQDLEEPRRRRCRRTSTCTSSARTRSKRGLLYLGTERGVMFSTDDGADLAAAAS